MRDRALEETQLLGRRRAPEELVAMRIAPEATPDLAVSEAREHVDAEHDALDVRGLAEGAEVAAEAAIAVARSS